jgi:ADP-ribose pyrophosphatase YjhB (NUDIX family)
MWMNPARKKGVQRSIRFAPRKDFETILEWAVIPTFDLVIEYGDLGVIVCKRRIAPYRGVWALPGLRMLKPESIEDTIVRIGQRELGLELDPAGRVFLGQYVGRFRTEHERQDLSTGFALRVSPSQRLKPNREHFSSIKIVNAVPTRTGAMYRHYLERHWSDRTPSLIQPFTSVS